MRIAIFSDSYKPSLDGVVTQIMNMASEFSKAGHDVLVVAPAHSRKFEERNKDRVRELLLPSIALPTYIDYRIANIHSGRVWKELKAFGPDIIHVQTPFSIGWQGLRYGKRLGIPVVGTYHTLIPEFLMYLPIPFLKKTGLAKMLTWKYTALFYNRCDVVTTPTKSMKDELERNGIRDAVVLSNAIDFRGFGKARKKWRADLKGRKKEMRLIYFGRVSYEKNIEVLLFALRHLLKKKIKVSLTITGDGPALPYLRKLAKETGIGGYVKFTGKMLGEKLAKHVARHDALVTASTIETQGLTILEAMAAGLPCIGADFLAIPDAVKDLENGLLFRPFDFGHLAHRIEEFISSSPTLKNKMSKNAVKTASAYSAGSIAGETVSLYRSSIKKYAKKKGWRGHA